MKNITTYGELKSKLTSHVYEQYLQRTLNLLNSYDNKQELLRYKLFDSIGTNYCSCDIEKRVIYLDPYICLELKNLEKIIPVHITLMFHEAMHGKVTSRSENEKRYQYCHNRLDDFLFGKEKKHLSLEARLRLEDIFSNIINIVEDKAIDHYLSQTYPGSVVYGYKLLEKNVNNNIIKKVLDGIVPTMKLNENNELMIFVESIDGFLQAYALELLNVTSTPLKPENIIFTNTKLENLYRKTSALIESVTTYDVENEKARTLIFKDIVDSILDYLENPYEEPENNSSDSSSMGNSKEESKKDNDLDSDNDTSNDENTDKTSEENNDSTDDSSQKGNRNNENDKSEENQKNDDSKSKSNDLTNKTNTNKTNGNNSSGGNKENSDSDLSGNDTSDSQNAENQPANEESQPDMNSLKDYEVVGLNVNIKFIEDVVNEFKKPKFIESIDDVSFVDETKENEESGYEEIIKLLEKESKLKNEYNKEMNRRSSFQVNPNFINKMNYTDRDIQAINEGKKLSQKLKQLLQDDRGRKAKGKRHGQINPTGLIRSISDGHIFQKKTRPKTLNNLRVVLAVDSSGSMNSDTSSGVSRMSVARYLSFMLFTIAEELNIEMKVYSFNFNYFLLADSKFKGDFVKRQLTRLESIGGTDQDNAVKHILQEFDVPQNTKDIFLLIPDDGAGKNIEEYIRKYKNQGVSCNVFPIMEQEDTQSLRYYQNIFGEKNTKLIVDDNIVDLKDSITNLFLSALLL